MITDLKPYPTYKQSGLQWLGLVPDSWEVKRAKSIFRPVDKRSLTGKEELLTVSSARGIVPRNTATVTMFKAASYRGYKLCWPGDLVINSLWAWAGGLGVSSHHGIISSAYGVYRIRPDALMLPEFVHHVVRSSSFSWELRVRSKGIWTSRLQLTDISFLDAPMPVPPVDEQVAIVQFLEWANTRLERAIRAKRKVIALLNEEKQAIICHAVTRGFDPSAPLKPSGVPWLGDIPEHWEVVQLGRLLSFGPKNGISPPPANRNSQGVTSFSIAAIRDGKFQIAGNEKQISLDQASVPRYRLCKGDILLVRGNGNVDFVARCALVSECPDDTVYPDIIIKVRPNEQIAAEFMVHAINSRYIRSQVACVAKTTNGAFKVSGRTLSALKLAVPPISEQQLLLDRLSALLSSPEHACQAALSHIHLLNEFRNRLVADVVTGKLDVREAAALVLKEVPAEGIGDDTDLSFIDPEVTDEECLV